MMVERDIHHFSGQIGDRSEGFAAKQRVLFHEINFFFIQGCGLFQYCDRHPRLSDVVQDASERKPLQIT
jgi:hypothetical protein